MAKKKGSSKHKQEEYKRYQMENRWLKNKLRRLKRHCKRFPEDGQAAAALDRTNHTYSRNDFKNRKKEPVAVKLKNLPTDKRLTLEEQIRRMLHDGDLVIRGI